MAQIGETIEHPLTGEQLTFLETAASTGGAKLRVAIEMLPGGLLKTRVNRSRSIPSAPNGDLLRDVLRPCPRRTI